MKKITFMIRNMKERVGLAPLAFGAFALAMFALYMWQLSIATSAGYSMRTVEEEIADLQRDIAGQQARISRLESIDSVTGRLQLLGLSKPQEISYVFTASGNVAVR